MGGLWVFGLVVGCCEVGGWVGELLCTIYMGGGWVGGLDEML